MREKEDRYIENQIEDKMRQCDESYLVTNTGFLDPHERVLAERLVRSGIYPEVRKVFSGGYEGSERSVLFCLPAYVPEEETDAEIAAALSVIRASVKEGGRKLKHGDYLGSLTGLGLSRSKIGDIIVREDGADIIICEEIREFLMTNYGKAGRSYLSLEEHPLSELILNDSAKEIMRDTIASLRLDNVVAGAFNVSRAKAAEAIRRGIVFVNSREELRTDAKVEQGDIVVLRGKGKIRLLTVGGRSKKDRIIVEYEKYK